MKPCPSCGRPAPLTVTPCPLTGAQVERCWACFDRNAVPPAVLRNTVNAIGWKQLPREIRQSVRVFDIEDYVTVPEYACRLASRQLAPCTPEQLAADEENAEAAYLVAKMKQVAVEPLPTPKPPRRFWRTAWQAALWCLGFEPARSAA
jgi:hypothetical protein